jgi:NNP family nitrate/nitrite transporter-like MFS transporter
MAAVMARARGAATWAPEDQAFWAAEGKRVASRNLWLSMPALFCGFAVWMLWSIFIVQMQTIGFPFRLDQLYTLTAIAGLSGATLRIPHSFLIALANGRNSVAVTTALLLLPCVGAGMALRDPSTPYWVFATLAALSGIGGGAFASSMSNISFFFPKRVQGTALGLNAGIGNLGVSAMQVLVPVVSSVALFGALAGDAPRAAGSGSAIFIQNGALVWVPLLAVIAVAAWFGMDNLPIHQTGRTASAVGRVLWLNAIGLACGGVGLFLLVGLGWSMWLVLPVTIGLTLAALRLLMPASARALLQRQYAIFNDTHTWTMTWLYMMTFGSFIGFSAAFPKLIQDVFGRLADGSVNPNAPNALTYAWLGPLVGSLVRPIGGWLSDRMGGARVTHWDTVLMIATSLGVAWIIRQAATAPAPDTWFPAFLGAFLVLFVATGLGNGSTFRMIPVIFEPAKAGPVLGWTSAVGAYGSFIIPKVFGEQIEAGHPEYALYGFVAFYLSCLAVNWWFYARKGAPVPC